MVDNRPAGVLRGSVSTERSGRGRGRDTPGGAIAAAGTALSCTDASGLRSVRDLDLRSILPDTVKRSAAYR